MSDNGLIASYLRKHGGTVSVQCASFSQITKWPSTLRVRDCLNHTSPGLIRWFAVDYTPICAGHAEALRFTWDKTNVDPFTCWMNNRYQCLYFSMADSLALDGDAMYVLLSWRWSEYSRIYSKTSHAKLSESAPNGPSSPGMQNLWCCWLNPRLTSQINFMPSNVAANIQDVQWCS